MSKEQYGMLLPERLDSRQQVWHLFRAFKPVSVGSSLVVNCENCGYISSSAADEIVKTAKYYGFGNIDLYNADPRITDFIYASGERRQFLINKKEPFTQVVESLPGEAERISIKIRAERIEAECIHSEIIKLLEPLKNWQKEHIIHRLVKTVYPYKNGGG